MLSALPYLSEWTWSAAKLLERMVAKQKTREKSNKTLFRFTWSVYFALIFTAVVRVRRRHPHWMPWKGCAVCELRVFVSDQMKNASIGTESEPAERKTKQWATQKWQSTAGRHCWARVKRREKSALRQRGHRCWRTKQTDKQKCAYLQQKLKIKIIKSKYRKKQQQTAQKRTETRSEEIKCFFFIFVFAPAGAVVLIFGPFWCLQVVLVCVFVTLVSHAPALIRVPSLSLPTRVGTPNNIVASEPEMAAASARHHDIRTKDEKLSAVSPERMNGKNETRKVGRSDSRSALILIIIVVISVADILHVGWRRWCSIHSIQTSTDGRAARMREKATAIRNECFSYAF